MGALDRIVSAGSKSEEGGHGRSAPGDRAHDAAKATVADPAIATPVDDAAGEVASAPTDLSLQREGAELGSRPRDDHRAPAGRGNRNGEPTSPADRALDETVDAEARHKVRREPAVRSAEAPATRDTRALTPRPVDETNRPKAAAAPPLPRSAAEPARVPQPLPVEIRREHVVRERVVERTLVDRLVIPQRPPAASEPPTPLPSLVRPLERAERQPERPTPRQGQRSKHDPSEPRPATPAPTPTTSALPADRDRPAPRREPNLPLPPSDRNAAREAPARPPAVQRNVDETPTGARRGERDARDRSSDTKDRATRAAPSRPVAALVAPRPPKPPAAPAQAPARDAARRASAAERPEPRPAARPTAPPRIQISIGRVEVRGKSAEPTVQRSPVSSPRSHQIDPGLGFGPLDGGRF